MSWRRTELSLEWLRTLFTSTQLNPARAKLAGGRKGALVDYSWSSLKHYSGNRGPDWLVRERVLAAFELARNGRGRRAYVNYLEERAKSDKGKLSPEAMKALQRGWYLGGESFRDKLLALAELKGLKGRKKTCLLYTSPSPRDRG